MDKIFGHEKIIDFFEKKIAEKQLSHAYLFVGPEHVGKRTVAEYIAAKIFSIPKEKLKTMPDFFSVEIRKNKKTAKTNQDILVDQIRELKSFLAQSSLYKDGYKIVLIDKAESLNKNAANSLLKVLEEPNKKIIFFLVCQNEETLLDTVKSRCQIINFSLVGINSVKDFFSPDIIKDYNGLIGELIEKNSDLTKKEFYNFEKQRFNSLFGKSFVEKLEIIEDLFGEKNKKDDHVLTRKKIKNILNIWLVETHNFIKEKKELNSDDIKNILNLEREINYARKFITKNIHPRLLLENIILQIP
ncbi:MAG: AAA family ATPase [Patescibacteria group bacterium]